MNEVEFNEDDAIDLAWDEWVRDEFLAELETIAEMYELEFKDHDGLFDLFEDARREAKVEWDFKDGKADVDIYGVARHVSFYSEKDVDDVWEGLVYYTLTLTWYVFGKSSYKLVL